MPQNRSPRRGRSTAKEVSVLAWIQDVYGNVLLVQQAAGRRLWSLPGGKVRGRESIGRALRREIKEEIGLDVVAARVLDLFDRPRKAGLAILFQVTVRKGRLKLAKAEIKSAAFAARLPEKSTPSVRYFWSRRFPRGRARDGDLSF